MSFVYHRLLMFGRFAVCILSTIDKKIFGVYFPEVLIILLQFIIIIIKLYRNFSSKIYLIMKPITFAANSKNEDNQSL